MAKLKLNMKKLLKPEANFISMVGRAANHIPFRIMKHDEGDMTLDLTSMQRVMKGAKSSSKVPAITAVVVRKGDDLEEVKQVIEKAGLKTDNMVESEDGFVVFAQAPGEPEDGAKFRMSDDMVIVTKGFEPWMAKLDSFAKRMACDGYYSGVSSASYALQRCIEDGVREAGSVQEAKTKVDSLLGEFHDYVIGLVAAIPAEAFRANDALAVYKADKKMNANDKKVEPKQDAVTSTATGGAPAEAKKDEVQKAAEVPVAAAPVTPPAPVTPAVTPEPVKEPVAKADPMEAVMAALGKLAEGQESIRKSVDEKFAAQAKELEAVKAQAAETIKKAAEAADQVKNTLTAMPKPGDAPKGTVQKSADSDDMGEGFYDSARRRVR